MYIVYVLSDKEGRYYKGMTNNLYRRLREHVSGKTITTKRMIGLKLVYRENYSNFKDARKRELYLKSSAGRRYLKKVLGNQFALPWHPPERTA